jgi:antitoxin (DNA-binding transcriptional repressor) of toxin-antitoxin stability system
MNNAPASPDAIEAALRELTIEEQKNLSEYKISQEALNTDVKGVTYRTHWDNRRAQVAAARTIGELETALTRAKGSIQMTCLALWAKGIAAGKTSVESLTRAAQKAETRADYFDRQGFSLYAEGQRKKAELLHRAAAGEAVEIPTRGNGVVAKVRAIFESMKDKPRKEVIAAAIAQGMNKNTVNTQYSRWIKGE